MPPGATMLTLLLTSSLAAPPAAPPAPPLRPFAELPTVPPRAGFLQTEAEVVELVRSLVGGLVRDERVIPVVFADAAQQPHYGSGVISVQRFTTRDAAWVRRELADGALPAAGALTGEWSDADLLDAWHAAHLAALANAYAHAIRDSWDRLDEANPVVEEGVARSLEGPLLDTLAAQGRIPARWPELYRRLTLDDSPPRPLDDALLITLGDYPEREREQLAETLGAFAGAAGLGAVIEKHDGPGPSLFTVSSDAAAVVVWAFAEQATVRAAAPLALSKGQRKKAAQVVNAWNHDLHGYTVIVEPAGLIVSTGEFSYRSAGDLRSHLDGCWEVLGIVAPALRGLGDGASVAETVAAPQALFIDKELVTW